MAVEIDREDFLVYDEVQEEIRAFFNITFWEEYALIQEVTQMIQNYDFLIVKKDYIKYHGILLKAYKQFTKIPHTNDFPSITLQKLKEKIDEIERMYIAFTTNKSHPQKYILSFTKKNQLLHYIQKEMPDLYDDMYAIVYREFKDLYSYETSYIKKTLKTILNTHVAYFEKLLWKEANESWEISHTFVTKGYSKINTDNFISYFFKNVYPYSNEYNEMKKMVNEL
jgi:hypothetical protein